MGFGRKMGAFLGLVPEGGREAEYSDADYADAEYASDYRESGYGYRGSASRDDRGAADVDDKYGDYREAGERFAEDYPAPASRDRDRERGRYGNLPERRPSVHEDPVVHGALAVQPRTREVVADAPSAAAGSRPTTVKLSGFGEARVIGEKYRDGQAVIMDMTDMADADARRLVDFAAGLAFARRGSIDKVATKVFMLLPPDVDVSAEDRREFAGAFGKR